jgi:hypothetical protein
MSDLTLDGENNDPKFLGYRLREIARQVADLVKWKSEVDLERQQLRGDAKTLAGEMAELKRAVDTLRKTILGFALTIAASSVIFALTVYASSRGGK